MDGAFYRTCFGQVKQGGISHCDSVCVCVSDSTVKIGEWVGFLYS